MWEGSGCGSTGIVAAGEVVSSIFLAADELLGVEELAVCAGADLVDHGGLQVQEHAPRHVLASTSLTEEGVEGIVSASHCLVTWHLPIRLHNNNNGSHNQLHLAKV